VCVYFFKNVLKSNLKKPSPHLLALLYLMFIGIHYAYVFVSLLEHVGFMQDLSVDCPPVVVILPAIILI